MKRILVFATIAATAASVFGKEYNLNADWRFSWAKGSLPISNGIKSLEKGGILPTAEKYDDSDWDVVSVPHPVNAHDTFDGHAVDAGEASFKRGVMIYRKRFTLPESNFGKAFLTFETVRQSIYVYVNGKMTGYYEAGIAPTAYDVTEYLRSGENTIVAVVENNAMRGTKVFTKETIPGHEPGDMSGQGYQWNTTDFNEVQGGLVGNVKLVLKKNKIYLTLPYYNNLKTTGCYITADDFDFEKGAATIKVDAEVRNESGKEAEVSVKFEITEVEAKGASKVEKAPSATDDAKYLTAVESDVYEKSPKPTDVNTPQVKHIEAICKAKGLVFWSPETPHLYDVTVRLVDDEGKLLDATTIRTGFRKVMYSAEEGGLKINGKNVWLPGYAQRSTDEWAAVGIPPDWMQDYDAALIRKSNANFVRWMHVAPKPAPVRAYDKFGVVNACPAGDKEGDTSGRSWAQRMEAMRDVMIYFRNSPSVVFWEAGNNKISAAHMKEMREMKEKLDPAGWRFIGSRTISDKAEVAEAEYVGTMLHRHEDGAFSSMAAIGKFMPMMETEYVRQESPRRVWDDYTPPHYDYLSRYLGGGKKETGFDVYDQTQEDFALSTAAEYAEFYASRASGKLAKTYTCCAALCWTDSNQHGRNSFSENCRSSGRVDAVRIPKENFYVFRTMQAQDPTVMLVGHWSYPKLTKDTYWYNVKVKGPGDKYVKETGEKAQRDPLHKTVYAVGSVHCASVELILNGVSKGVNSKPKDIFIYEFPNIDITESGYAEVIARDADGNIIARNRVDTFDERSAKIKTKVMTGPAGWVADGADIAIIDFSLVDAKGTVHPWASDKISFVLEGDAKFMGGWNSGTFDETSPIGKDWVNLECGVTRVFVKSGRTAGKVSLKWTCANGESGVVKLETKEVTMKGGILSAMPAEYPANKFTFARKTNAPAVQDLTGGRKAEVPYDVYVNGKKVGFHKGFGAPKKIDATTGVTCAFVPVLSAIKEAGGEVEFEERGKGRMPKHLKDFKLPLLTIKAGGKTIEAANGETALWVNSGEDKNLMNCELWAAHPKGRQLLTGELISVIGYIPNIDIKTDDVGRKVEITVK